MSLYSSSSAYMKDTWLPVLNNQLEHSEGSLLKKLGMNYDAPTKIEGRKAFMKLQIGDDTGFGVNAQGGDFSGGGDATYDEATLELMRFNATITLDGHEKGLADSLSAAAAPIIQRKMANAKSRVARELERIAIMDGSGKLAKIASVSTTAITLDVAGSDYTERNAYTWIDDAYRSLYTTVDGTTGADEVSDFTVSNVAESTNVLTASTSAAASGVGDFIVTGGYGSSAWTTGGAISSREFPGLLKMISNSGTYLGINRATSGKAYWKAVEDNNSGTLRTFTETLANTLCNKLARRAEDGMVSQSDHFAIASPGTWTSYMLNMSTGIRYTVAETPDIGWGGREMLMMNGIKLYKHIHAPRNMVLVIHTPSTKFVTAKHTPSDQNLEFVTGNGGDIWFPATASSGQGYADKWYAYITGFLGMYSERPRNNAKLDDLTETSGAY